MNSLVELQVNSENNDLMSIVGPRTQRGDTTGQTPLRHPVQTLLRQTAHSASDREYQPLTDVEFHDIINKLDSERTLEDISDPGTFNNLMVELKRVYNDGIRRLKGSTGQQVCIPQRKANLCRYQRVHEALENLMVNINKLYSKFDREFLESCRLMVVIFHRKLHSIIDVYTAIRVRDNICYALECDKIDLTKSNLDEENLSEVKGSVTNGISRNRNNALRAWTGLYFMVQVNRCYRDELMRAAERILSHKKALPEGFDTGLLSQDGNSLVPVSDAGVEKYLRFVDEVKLGGKNPIEAEPLITNCERICDKYMKRYMQSLYLA